MTGTQHGMQIMSMIALFCFIYQSHCEVGMTCNQHLVWLIMADVSVTTECWYAIGNHILASWKGLTVVCSVPGLQRACISCLHVVFSSVFFFLVVKILGSF